MQPFQPSSSLLQVQTSVNAPRGFQIHLNNMAMLPVMCAPAVPCPCPSQLMHPKGSANAYQKARARIQTQQIDSAIQLLKMQYDAIMASVQISNLPVEGPQQSTSATSPQVVDQKSFAMQFELPRPESDEQGAATTLAIDTTSACKRKTDSHPDENTRANKTSESSLPSKKRLRRQ
jgi:hypothetical protein